MRRRRQPCHLTRAATEHPPAFGSLGRAFADFICRLAKSDSSSLWLAAAMLSDAVGKGNVCIDLRYLAGETAEAAAEASGILCNPESPWTDSGCWCEELRRFSDLINSEGTAPLVLDGSGRLYLNRYWYYEQHLAAALLERAQTVMGDVDEKQLAASLDQLFPPLAMNAGVDRQRLAAALSVWRSLTIIAGGPGTGKTTTVVKVLALLLEQAAGRVFKIALAAPTGKASARLREAVTDACELLPLSPELKSLIPCEAVTLHRLIGVFPGSVNCRHNRNNPLPFDLILVDEASMIDLPLMARLVDALPVSCRLILLGDPDQLASVEAGAVLGDICHPLWLDSFSQAQLDFFQRVSGQTFFPAANHKMPDICDSVVKLNISHRFGEGSGIDLVARLVNEGKGEEALARMRHGGYSDIVWHDLPPPGDLSLKLKDRVIEGYGSIIQDDDPLACIELLGRFRILSPLRKGVYGVESLNLIAERLLATAGRKTPGSPWYSHRPVMVTGNDYQLRLANGDIGIALPGADDKSLSVWFPVNDGSVRQISPLRLFGCETVYAMTVHKSQGSEFDSILLLLPDAMPELLTRELVYTAITRARRKVEIWGNEESFIAAVSRRVRRSSGLCERLWGEVRQGVEA